LAELATGARVRAAEELLRARSGAVRSTAHRIHRAIEPRPPDRRSQGRTRARARDEGSPRPRCARLEQALATARHSARRPLPCSRIEDAARSTQRARVRAPERAQARRASRGSRSLLVRSNVRRLEGVDPKHEFGEIVQTAECSYLAAHDRM